MQEIRDLEKIPSDLIDALLKSFLDESNVSIAMENKGWSVVSTVVIDCSGFGDYLKKLLLKETKNDGCTG